MPIKLANIHNFDVHLKVNEPINLWKKCGRKKLKYIADQHKPCK